MPRRNAASFLRRVLHSSVALLKHCYKQNPSPPLFVLTEHPCDKRQQLLQRIEMSALPGHDMLDATGDAPAREVRAQTEVHDERPVDG